MAKTFQPTVLTANDLVEGTTVFLSAEGWRREIARAMVAVTPEQATDLEALGARDGGEQQVIGSYLIDISTESGAPVPVLRRERIRAMGVPTIAVGPEADRRHAA